MEIEFGGNAGARQAVEGIADEGKGQAVLDRDRVEGAVVDAQAEGTDLLSEKRELRRRREILTAK